MILPVPKHRLSASMGGESCWCISFAASSINICGNCVVFRHPVAPQSMTTSFSNTCLQNSFPRLNAGSRFLRYFFLSMYIGSALSRDSLSPNSKYLLFFRQLLLNMLLGKLHLIESSLLTPRLLFALSTNAMSRLIDDVSEYFMGFAYSMTPILSISAFKKWTSPLLLTPILSFFPLIF